MRQLHIFVLLWSCQALVAGGYVSTPDHQAVNLRAEESSNSTEVTRIRLRRLHNSIRNEAEKRELLSFLWGGVAKEDTRADQYPDEAVPRQMKENCLVMLCIVLVLCFGQYTIQNWCGQAFAAVMGFSVSVALVTYLLMSGTYSAFWAGEPVGLPCKIMCWWALLWLCSTALLLCCSCMFVGAAVAIKNEQIKQMKGEFNEKEKNLSQPRQEYYKSAAFTCKCEKMFDKFDMDKNGTLDMSELKEALREEIGIADMESLEAISTTLKMAFDDNWNSKIERHEFSEMMKFISVMQFEEGKIGKISQAYEILQLDEDIATKADIAKAYRNLARQYHPDKRVGVDYETAKKDMAEINDSHTAVQNHLKEKASQQSGNV